jgi:hypothetical protein
VPAPHAAPVAVGRLQAAHFQTEHFQAGGFQLGEVACRAS